MSELFVLGEVKNGNNLMTGMAKEKSVFGHSAESWAREVQNLDWTDTTSIYSCIWLLLHNKEHLAESFKETVLYQTALLKIWGEKEQKNYYI